jgi:NADH-quinone oxidoreductase subunit M
MFGIPLLSSLLWFPLLAAVLLFFVKNDEGSDRRLGLYSLGVFAVNALLAAKLYLSYNLNAVGGQLAEKIPLFGNFLTYSLDVDAMGLAFILLSAVIFFICPLFMLSRQLKQPREFYICLLALCGLVNGVFSTSNLLLFYIFFEATLVPLFIMIGIWGGKRRVYASIKFFLFTLAGSLLMLTAMIYLYNQGHTLELSGLLAQPATALAVQQWLFAAFFIAFAVKVPMWPVHTWLPDAHVEAPTVGSVLLAAIMLKIGGYGMAKFMLPLFPEASHYFAPFVMTLSAIAIVYASFVAFAQTDMKKLVAYSSIAHMGYVTMALFTFNMVGMQAAMFQMISHGFVSAGLFFVIGVLYDRFHSRDMGYYGGLAPKMPLFATVFMILTMANVGLPGTSGFVGEFLALVGVYSVNPTFALIAATGVIMSAAYGLMLYRKIMFGVITNPELETAQDMNKMDWLVFAPLIALTLYFGLQTTVLTEALTPSLQAVLDHVHL